MSIEMLDSVLNINADAVMTTAMAAVLLLIGYFIKSKVSILNKYCIPAPVVGGFLFMFVTFAGHVTNTFKFNFTTSFQDPFMLAFFTTVGLGASFSLLKKGGILLVIYWATAGVISIFQNVIGIAVSKVISLEAPYALLASAISMIGGHGAAGAYGKTFAEMGYSAGIEVGAAAATFGLISAVLVGGPLARRLIVKYDLKPDEDENFESDIDTVNASTGEKLSSLDVIKNVTGGVLIVVLCQVLFMILIAYFVVFRVLGKNYDAAVMCAGLCGHGLGATPSAIVNMTSVKDRYGMSRRAFMIVPIVGAFLVDIIYQPQTIAFIKFFVKGFTG